MSAQQAKQKKKKAAEKGKKKRAGPPARTVTKRVSNNFYADALAPIVRSEIKSAIKSVSSGNSSQGHTSIKMEGVPTAMAVSTKGTNKNNPGGAYNITMGNNGVMTVRQRKYVGTITNHIPVVSPVDPGGARLTSTFGNTTYFISPSDGKGDLNGIFPLTSGFISLGDVVTDYKTGALLDYSSMAYSMSQFYEFWQPEWAQLDYEPEANTNQHGMIGIAWSPMRLGEFVVGTGSTTTSNSNDYTTMSQSPVFGSANLYLPLSVRAHPLQVGFAESNWLRTYVGAPTNAAYSDIVMHTQAGCWIINVDEPAETEVYGRLFYEVSFRYKGARPAPQESVGYVFYSDQHFNNLLTQWAGHKAYEILTRRKLPHTSSVFHALLKKERQTIKERIATLPEPQSRVFRDEFLVFAKWLEDRKKGEDEFDLVGQ